MFRCRDLLALPNMSRARLLAGENGLDNQIRWSYKAENMNFSNWVHGQELLIVSTPLICSSNFDLHTVIETAISLRLAGVLLLVGEDYISSIAVRTLNLANVNRLPVISIPGDIPLVDILEELGHAIAFQDSKKSVHDDLLAGIIFENKIEPRMVISRAELIGYEIKEKQRVFMIHISFADEIKAQGMMNLFSEKLELLFQKKKSAAIISRFHCNLIGLTGEDNHAILDGIFEEFSTYIAGMKEKITCQIGVGSAYKELSVLNKSFSEASGVLKLANPVQWYERLGFMKLLLDVEDQKSMAEYMEQILGKIIKHDEDNNSELVKTLISYFDCNENMKEVGSRLFIHPNTVKYRIQQIQDISGYNLSKTGEKMELYNALLIWKIIGREIVYRNNSAKKKSS